MTTFDKKNVAIATFQGNQRGLVLGQRIRDVRLERGLRQVEFAARLGVSRSYLSEAERGKSKPSVEMIVGIATEFPEVSLRWLLTGATSEPQHLVFPNIDHDLLAIAAAVTERRVPDEWRDTDADNMFFAISVAYREVLEAFEELIKQGQPRANVLAALRRLHDMPDPA